MPVVLLFALAAAPPPNVLLIVSDDHGWADYGHMGHPHLRTPHLDKLAADGICFPRGYVPSSLCCPSLATILTGRFPHQHKITSNDPPRPAGMKPAEFPRSAAFRAGRERMCQHLDAVPTLPKLLADRGYLCLQTGKWWQGDFRRGGFTHGMTNGGRHGDAGLDIGRKTLEPIISFVADARKQGKPWLVWYAPMLPHTPHDAPADLVAKYRAAAGSEAVARYWASVERFDATVGELFAKLGPLDDTLVVYLADNGWTQDPAAVGRPVRSKQTPYDAGLRTPVVVRWPGRATPGRTDTPVSSVDVAPTVLAACGLPVPAGLPGVNLLDPAAVAGRDAVFGACFTHDAVDLDDPAKNVKHRWVVSGGRKLIVPHGPADGPAAVELYDVAADPREGTDLSRQRPAEVATLRAKLNAWWTP